LRRILKKRGNDKAKVGPAHDESIEADDESIDEADEEADEEADGGSKEGSDELETIRRKEWYRQEWLGNHLPRLENLANTGAPLLSDYSGCVLVPTVKQPCDATVAGGPKNYAQCPSDHRYCTHLGGLVSLEHIDLVVPGDPKFPDYPVYLDGPGNIAFIHPHENMLRGEWPKSVLALNMMNIADSDHSSLAHQRWETARNILSQ
jgi:hypothetical protein